MKQCEKCGSTEKVTRHHVDGGGEGIWVYLCEACHDEEHGITRHEDEKALQRRIRRARRRIRRDTKIVEETEAQLHAMEKVN